MTENRMKIAWCRCGPFASALEAIKRAEGPAFIEWRGRQMWISSSARPIVGHEVELLEADLCHAPGRFTRLAIGRVSRVTAEGTTVRIGIDFIPISQHPQLSGERGKLIFAEPNPPVVSPLRAA